MDLMTRNLVIADRLRNASAASRGLSAAALSPNLILIKVYPQLID